MARRHSAAQQKRDQSERKRPVALPQRPIIPPFRADLHGHDAGHLADDAQHHEQLITSAAGTPGTSASGRYSPASEMTSPNSLSTAPRRDFMRMLAGEHAVDRVQRHPHEQHRRHQQQHAARIWIDRHERTRRQRQRRPPRPSLDWL